MIHSWARRVALAFATFSLLLQLAQRPAFSLLAADGKPRSFLAALAKVPEDRKRFLDARTAVFGLAGGDAAQSEFRLQCLELLAAEPEITGGIAVPQTGGAALASLVSGLQSPAASSRAMRARAFAASMRLWAAADLPEASQTGATATRIMRHAVRCIMRWGISKEDVTCSDSLKNLFADVLSNNLWDYASDLVQAFPQLASGLNDTKTSTMNSGNKLRWLQADTKDITRIPESLTSKMQLLIAEGNARGALRMCGQSELLKMCCLQILLQEGMASLAAEVAEDWWLPISREDLARASEAKVHPNFFSLPENVSVSVVCREEEAVRAIQTLQQGEIVGIDVENSRKGDAAIVQLASFSQVFIFDMLVLGDSKLLGDAFAALLADESVRTLGFGGQQDVKSIRRASGFGACREVVTPSPFLDMQRYAAEKRATEANTSVKTELHGLSLSKLVADTMGKPLDKTWQQGNWVGRPLSAMQLQYAALDAWILLELFDRLNLEAESTDT
eukprot:TRINITY_DN28369_c0_g1_i1.p1 TRINITY_DN28369_c0_g1~~TRINITY_DN28369_c0_g1_i1.p1  ORF type:complete len:504 (-),score=102.43 TRINITY_DN28369_c0_g1_i1:22-1533(-)